jgi:hypothetical protein
MCVCWHASLFVCRYFCIHIRLYVHTYRIFQCLCAGMHVRMHVYNYGSMYVRMCANPNMTGGYVNAFVLILITICTHTNLHINTYVYI